MKIEIIKNYKNIKALSKIDNINDLTVAMEDEASIEEVLEHIAFRSAVDEKENDSKVSLMTLYSAKCSDYEFVCIPGGE